MTKVMEPDRRKRELRRRVSRSLRLRPGDGVVVAQQVPRVNRRANPGGEHVPGFLPACSCPFPFKVLVRFVGNQRGNASGRESHTPPAWGGLRFNLYQPLIDAL